MNKMIPIADAMEAMQIDNQEVKHAMTLDRMAVKAFLLFTLDPMVFDIQYTDELRKAIESI